MTNIDERVWRLAWESDSGQTGGNCFVRGLAPARKVATDFRQRGRRVDILPASPEEIARHERIEGQIRAELGEDSVVGTGEEMPPVGFARHGLAVVRVPNDGEPDESWWAAPQRGCRGNPTHGPDGAPDKPGDSRRLWPRL